MNEDVITQNTSPDPVDVPGADGGSTDNPNALSLEELNSYLGKNFKDKDTALKSLKDTYRYVGNPTVDALSQKLGAPQEQVAEALKTLMSTQPAGMTQEQYQEDRFFDKNPDLEELRPQLSRLRSSDPEASKQSWSEFIKSPLVAPLVEKVKGYNEIQGRKSVLESNPRLGAVSDKLSEAKKLAQEARQSGDPFAAQQAENAARESAVRGVLEAYDLT
jgi:hypothetical protein